MNTEELNKKAEMIIMLANKGVTPQFVMQQLIGGNIQSYPQQINQTMTQLNNMAEGKPLSEFMIQALKQNGLTEQNAKGLSMLLGIK